MEKLAGLVRLDGASPGHVNMSIDNSLLQALAPDSPITLRIYQWSEPTLSLGHFQREDDIDPRLQKSKLPKVRRVTGGGAILHHHEWTYSLLIPDRPELGLKGHSESIYRSVHTSIAQGLRDQGWDACLSEECSCALNKDKGEIDPFLCFLRRSPVDVIVERDKILGSAQRRARNGLLQHGSLILRRSPFASEIVGLLDLPRNFPSSAGFTMVLPTLWTGLDQDDLLAGEGKVSNPCFFDECPGETGAAKIQEGILDGRWLAERVIIGLDQVFECSWELESPN